MRRDRRLLRTVCIAALGGAAALAVFVAGGLALFTSTLSDDERQAWNALIADRAAAVLLPGLALVALVAALAAIGHRRYIAAPAQLAERAQVLLTASVHRDSVDAAWPPALQQLALTLAALARQRDALQVHIAEEVTRASRGIEQERNRLAALMSELTQSVVVCNLDGRILLYNRRAQLQFRTLSDAPHLTAGVDLLGLGRSIYRVFDREPVAHALEQVQRRLTRGAAQPTAEFVTATRSGQLLRVQLAPVRAVDDGPDAKPTAEAAATPVINGFVLMLDNFSQQVSQVLPQTGPLELTEADVPLDPFAVLGDSRPIYYDFDLFARRDVDPSQGEQRLVELSFTIFDAETTGLDPTRDEIIQIGAVRLVNGKLLRGEHFDQLVDPRRAIPAPSISIHGITDERVRGQPTIGEVLPAFHRYARDTVLVAHNAAFDMRFLQMKEATTGVSFDQPVLDTLLLSEVVHPSQDSHRLEAIAERLGVTVMGRHTALGDARITAEVFRRLVPLLADRGIHTLGQAVTAAQGTSSARLRY